MPVRLNGSVSIADALPLVLIPHVAGVARVHADDDVELLDPLPEGVELGQRERLAALPCGHRRDAHQEDLGPAFVDVLELLERRARCPAARLMIGVE